MLLEKEQKAINEFKDFLLANYPQRIELIELFGSKARGNGDKESDIDLLVVVDKEDREFEDKIIGIMSELCLKYNTLISPVVFEKEVFVLEKRVKTPLIREINKDGVLIWKGKDFNMEDRLKDQKEELKIIIDDMIEKSQLRLISAKLMLKNKFYEDVASRAYYAMCYAIEAMLLTKDMASGKHSGVVGFFNQYFIKEGIFDKKWSKLIDKAWKLREMADYRRRYKVTEEDAKESLNNAEEFVMRAKGYLGKFFSK